MHIAAGNADSLPVFSVLEGLLTGNINILKLPEIDGGLSVMLLQELVCVEPALSDYIYVFDYSSKDVASIDKLIQVADGVVIWGGDEAVSALRSMVPPNRKLIEWGHRSSFAYVGKPYPDPNELMGLAHHICWTNQLLCSSCQGIFIDTEQMEDVYKFCEMFLPVLEMVRGRQKSVLDIGTQAQVTLQLYNESLETIINKKKIIVAMVAT